MAISKEIRNLEDLKARKAQLREEVRLSRERLEENLEGILHKKSLRKVVAGAAMSWLTAYTVRLFRRGRAEAQAFGASSNEAKIAGYMPIIRKVLNYVLDYLEYRYTRPSQRSGRY